MPTPTEELWTSPAWRDEVEGWIRDAVAVAGLDITAPLEQVRLRVWSTQLTVQTSAGQLWFKENHPGQAAEAAVIDELARLTPDHVVVPLAVERSRGWLLTPDHGATLATVGRTDERTWSRVVAEFADLQRRVSSHGAALRAAGLVAMLPESAGDYVEQQIERLRRLPASDFAHVEADLADHVLAALPSIRATTARLADAGPPLASLEHNDLHHNNVFVPSAEESTLRFFDFGDAVWAHPFTTLNIPVRVLCEEWKTAPDDPRIQAVIDSYLEVWSDLAPITELRESARLARQLAPLHRLESWRRLLEGSSRGETPDVVGTLEYWWARIAGIGDP